MLRLLIEQDDLLTEARDTLRAGISSHHPTVFCALLDADQIKIRTFDDGQKLAIKRTDQTVDPAA